MPTPTTQAERSAAIARLRDHIQDPDRVPLRLADLTVLLNPNALAVVLAAENERLRALTSHQATDADDDIAAIVKLLDDAKVPDRDLPEERVKWLIDDRDELEGIVNAARVALGRRPIGVQPFEYVDLAGEIRELRAENEVLRRCAERDEKIQTMSGDPL